MSISKKIIIQNLKDILKKNKFIFDIWFYGSFKDRISDIDIIIVYKKLPKKIQFPKILNDKMYGGTVIFVPKKLRFNLFLFEKLNIFSIKNNTKIKHNLKNSHLKLMYLTSFLERYYERRDKLKNINNHISESNIRDIKSIIMSYQTFYDYCSLAGVPFNKKNFMKKYFELRKKYINKKSKGPFLKFVRNLKAFDENFHSQSIKILDKKFLDNSNSKFSFYFRDLIFKYKYGSLNNIPFIYGCLYNFYANQKLKLSHKIKKDFKISKISYDFKKDEKIYFVKKIQFLNQCYLDLKYKKFKSGLYRLTWYL